MYHLKPCYIEHYIIDERYKCMCYFNETMITHYLKKNTAIYTLHNFKNRTTKNKITLKAIRKKEMSWLFSIVSHK